MLRYKKTIGLLAGMSLFLAACGEEVPDMEGGDSAEEEFDIDVSDEDNTLMVGMTNAPAQANNPFDIVGTADKWARRFMYDSILSMPTTTDFEPRLGSIDTEDNQVFTIELKEDAYWSDGEPITSADVAFTLNSIADPDVVTSEGTYIAMIEGTTSAGYLEDGAEELSGVEIIDEHTLEITTKEPADLAYVSEFLGFNVLIAPEHVLGDIPGEDLPTSDEVLNPTVFSGPYKYVEYEEENYLHLEANEDYHLGAPEIDEIYMRVMNGTALLTEFQAGNLHMAAGGGVGMVSHEDIELLQDIDGLVVEENPGFSLQALSINTGNPRYEDPQVRRAFVHAMNRELIVENLLDGLGEAVPSLYTSASPYKHESLDMLEYDPELARELLEEANFDFDEPIELVVPTGNAIREQAGDLVEQWLVEIGLNVNQQNYDFTTWLAMAEDLDYEMGLMGLSLTVDPNIQTFVHTDGSFNIVDISDSEIDRLIEEGNAGTSFEERLPIYEELQEYLQEEMPYIPLYSDSQFGVRVEELDGGIEEYWAGSLHDVHEWTLNP